MSKLLTTREAAAILNVKENTLAVWRKNKKHDLPFIKIGRSIRYNESDLENFLANRLFK